RPLSWPDLTEPTCHHGPGPTPMRGSPWMWRARLSAGRSRHCAGSPDIARPSTGSRIYPGHGRVDLSKARPAKETVMRILIAEDDQVLADGLLRTLRGSGAAVDHVASGSEADSALMTNNEFDLLILDLGLPRMHGLEVLKRLRSRGSALPVLILTAADSIEER
ncbi:hypothetical protein KXX11_004250, partial [Aspergillus fumigatus]